MADGTVNEIALPDGARLKREARTSGANGWLLYDRSNKLVRAMNLVEVELIDSVLAARAQQEPVGWIYGNSYWEVGNPRLTDHIRQCGEPRYAAPVAQQSEPVARVDEGDDGLFVEILYGVDGSPLKLGDSLYLHRPVAQQSEAGAQDAARYRFLREHWVSFSAAPPLSNLHWKGDKLDAKVDAAILEGGAHG